MTISLLCNKVGKNIGILRRIKNKIPVTLLRNLYFTLINPYFEYCNVIWAISSSIALVKLFRIQKRAIRLIANSEWNMHTACSFVSRLEYFKYPQLNLLQVALSIYKVYNNLYDHSISLICLYLIALFTCHDTRQRGDFHVPYHPLVSTSNSVYRVNVWNSIYKDIMNIKSLKLFRTKYKYCIIQR